MSENRCVCCGDIIPEGRQVCPYCETPEIFVAEVKTRDKTYTLKGSFLQCANWTDSIMKLKSVVEVNIRRAI